MTTSRTVASTLHALVFVCATVVGGLASAQEPVTEVRELERCITEHQTHLSRLVRLITEAEGRTSSSDAAVARDAREAITALVHRAHDVRAHLELCIREAQIPSAHAETHVTHEAHTPGSAEDRVSAAGGTVQVVHPAESIGSHVRVVSGERVDGRGTVPHEDLRRSVRTWIGTGVDRCYASFMDRASARSGEVEITFAAVDGAIREVAVERMGPFDAAFRTCAVQAVSGMQLNHTSGRSVFAYVLAVGE